MDLVTAAVSSTHLKCTSFSDFTSAAPVSSQRVGEMGKPLASHPSRTGCHEHSFTRSKGAGHTSDGQPPGLQKRTSSPPAAQSCLPCCPTMCCSKQLGPEVHLIWSSGCRTATHAMAVLHLRRICVLILLCSCAFMVALVFVFPCILVPDGIKFCF